MIIFILRIHRNGLQADAIGLFIHISDSLMHHDAIQPQILKLADHCAQYPFKTDICPQLHVFLFGKIDAVECKASHISFYKSAGHLINKILITPGQIPGYASFIL